MPSNTEITVSQLLRLTGLPDAPSILDVRTAEDFAGDPRLLPAATRHDATTLPARAAEWRGQHVVVVCRHGRKISQGAAAWLRHAGARAETLDGGFEAWCAAGGPLIPAAAIPPGDAQGRTVWVTRARPKVDRTACPWLIRRFVDPRAVFLFVAAAEVGAVAERFGATPFDIEGCHWSHRGERCTFDAMVEAFGLSSPAMERLATIIRGADTARLDLAPQAAGFLAAALGFSRMFRDDLAQLDACMPLYDALYRWSRDAADETHDWPSPGARA
ncbi:chromate resistance protein ChrB domain-containing protein [Azospirillum halopraeferens]|uniref:chromate resistance protein ChrB domain-containing protein n=1 Tax=Azospirillum halopraeferens TaxID=34010 RepID=UPI0004132306|nr:chromate resistance protein ChrB domain-containing protein [Azospirillum halopraeferens]